MKHWFIGPVTSARIQFLRYIFVGGTAAVVNLVSYGFFTEGLAIHYLLAAFLGYTLGFLWNYLISVLWVFKSRHSRRREVVMVVVITMGGLLWTELILYFFVEFGHLHHFLGMFITLWIVLIWNFGMRKKFVFH
jgi:putative flippase GtrA